MSDDSYDYAAEEEAEWRSAPAWSVNGFFEMLKDQYRSLEFVPIDSRTVYDRHTRFRPESQELLSAVSEVFKRYGWPDLDGYQKADCLRAIRVTLEERYPHTAKWLTHDEEEP